MRCRGPLVALVSVGLAAAQGPAFQGYGRRDGLTHDQVRCLHQDERGYLWVGTAGRTCRHDGTTICQWPVDTATPERVDRIAAATGGRVFLGGSGPTIHAYDPDAEPCFRAFEVRGENVGRNVTALAVDGRERLFVATEAGLFAAECDDGVCSLHAVERDVRDAWYGALAVDDRGRLLYARSGRALRLDGDGTTAVELPPMPGNAWTIEPVGADRCRVLTDRRLWEVDFAARSCRALPLPPALDKRCTTMRTDRRGAMWLGTVDGLWRLADGAPPERMLDGVWVHSLCVDRSGDVWVGTQQNGLLRAAARPFASLAGNNGERAVRPVRLLRVGDAVFVATHTDGVFRVGEGDLQPTRWYANAELRTGSAVEADAFGSLWFAADRELLQVAANGDGAVPVVKRWPLAVRRLFRDTQGRVVCSTGDAVVTLVADGGNPPRMVSVPVPAHLAGGAALGGDGVGGLYYRTFGGDLWFLAGAAAQPCTDRGARLAVGSFCQDRGGHLWFVSNSRPGFAVAEAGSGAALDPRWITPADGLPGSRVLGLIPDEAGGVWLTFASALCHFDAATGSVAVWPWPADVGLAGVHGMLVDAAGRVLVATDDHVVAFTPAAQMPAVAPAVLVTSLLVAGAPVRLPDGGTAAPRSVSSPAGRGDFLVTFVAPGGRAGAAPVQARLVPAADAFGAPLNSPTLQFASLAPGRYRLELRAAAVDGLSPGPTTTVELHVPQPFWARAEFLAGVAVLMLLAGVLVHRARVRRLLAMEAVRRQVATDLHDDLGSGLAQVAVLSEVVKRRAPLLAATLDEIGGLARGMRESLSDIVWAVDPTKDTLSAVVQRLRQVATNLFDDGATIVRWTSPDAAEMDAVGLRPDRRRHLFLFCKEALTNAARHARARTVTIDVGRTPAGLRVVMADDGCGFESGAHGPGNGLRSLENRAAALGAILALHSEPGRGTTIELVVPLA